MRRRTHADRTEPRARLHRSSAAPRSSPRRDPRSWRLRRPAARALEARPSARPLNRTCAALLVAAGLVVASCSGGDGDADAPPEETTSTTASTAPDPAPGGLVPADLEPADVTFHAILADGPCEDLDEGQDGAGAAGGEGEGEGEGDAAAGDVGGADDGGDLLQAADGFWCYRVGDLVRDGTTVAAAEVVEASGTWAISATFDPAAVDSVNELFDACFEGTERCPAREGGTGYVAIAVNGTVISAPAISAPDLANDRLIITGDLAQDEAERLAAALS